MTFKNTRSVRWTGILTSSLCFSAGLIASAGLSSSLAHADPVLAASVASEAAGPSNGVIDLTIPGPQEPQTDAEVFDESVLFSPNFAINQNDPALSDLFGSDGESGLCFPTSFAEDLTYLFAYRAPTFASLQLSGLSPDRDSLNPNALIRQLVSLCHTDPNKGTDSTNGLQCALALLSQSGYGAGETKLISPFDQDAALPILTRDLTIADIRAALKTGFPIILEVAWFAFDPASKQWVRSGGHYVGVYGYDYDLSWGENQIQVKVVNPNISYGSSRAGAIWDTVTIERVSPQPGVTYPADRPFILSGTGFGGLAKRGFLGEMLLVAPTVQSLAGSP